MFIQISNNNNSNNNNSHDDAYNKNNNSMCSCYHYHNGVLNVWLDVFCVLSVPYESFYKRFSSQFELCTSFRPRMIEPPMGRICRRSGEN